MTTLREYREQAGLSLSELARRANVDYKTAKKADEGTGVIRGPQARALLQVISQFLGKEIRIEDVEKLIVH